MHNTRYIFILILCCSGWHAAKAQPLPDSVRAAFNIAKEDIQKGKVLIRFFDMNTDKNSLLGSLAALRIYFEKEKQPVIVDYVDLGISRQQSRGAEYAESLKELFRLMPKFEKRKDAYGIMVCNRHLSYAYYAARDSGKTLYYDRQTAAQSVVLGNKFDIAVGYNNLAADLAEYGQFDSAYYYARNAVDLAEEINHPALISKTLSTMGEGFSARKEYDSALYYLRKSLPIAVVHSQLDHFYGLNDLSQVFYETNQNDSSIYYASAAVRLAGSIHLMNQLFRAYQNLYKAYQKTGPVDSAYKYLQFTLATQDSIYSAEATTQVQLIGFREQNRQKEIEQERIEFKKDIKIYGLIGSLVVFSFLGFLLYRNSEKEKKAKLLLQKKNETIERTLLELKDTQAQLIQSEKMASLGELTAGIAHEIQNPLNFVNNFSELSRELIDELKVENGKLKDDRDEQLEKEILDNIDTNLEKINHHGKRADAIVKGMLQHSQSSSGKKEPTDINKLADEYLRLSYNGLRAKDKSFNATINTEYDESIGDINIIPQDIGRVLLNLFNNAFYAVKETTDHRRPTTDSKNEPTVSDNLKSCQAEPVEAGLNYEPTISIITERLGDKIEIKVSDNGNGIPPSIIDKIFQPFFTTKPTGQGTGLGLSLSYDIITKGHGGELKVETKAAENAADFGKDITTRFIITLPMV